jgi:two-component system, NarL family, nitrate/nitrite response regulator NarL
VIYSIRPQDSLARVDMLNEGFDVVVMVDDPVTRAGMSVVLRETPGVRRVVGCQDSDEAMRAMSTSRADVLVLLCLKGGRGLERMASLLTSAGTKVLVVVDETDMDNIVHSMSLCPDGIVLRAAFTSDVLMHTLVRLANGELPIPAPIARKLLTQARVPRHESHQTPSHSRLTGREMQTLELLTVGCSNKQIARRLGISEHGAKRYVSRVLAKLNCLNRTSAVAWALKSGLIKGPAEAWD